MKIIKSEFPKKWHVQIDGVDYVVEKTETDFFINPKATIATIARIIKKIENEQEK